ncbi:MAG: GNAT family N-acetyltransferase [Candidatus Woesearchaeota archaeon]
MYQSIFISPFWLNVLKKTYGLRIVLIQYVNHDRNGIKIFDYQLDNVKINFPYLPLVRNKSYSKLISLPFTDYVNIDNDILKVIANSLLETYPNSIVEIRTSINDEKFEKKLIGYSHKLYLYDAIDNIYKKFKLTQVQQPIQKAFKEGLTYEISDDIQSVENFYKLHLITRRKLGIPIQPKKFFFHIWNEIIKNGYGFIVLVYKNSKVISSGIFLGTGNTLIYKFSASNPEYLRLRPNNLMLWTAIQEAKRRGYSVFDFGRTEIENEGLRKFKLGWGTIEEPLYYSYYPQAPDDTKFKWIKNKIVAPIIRNSPKFVCRLSGELFYKYFG